LAELYRDRIASLQTELARSNGSNSAVLEALRDLVERVDFGPGPEGGEPEIILTGALSAMVRLGLWRQAKGFNAFCQRGLGQILVCSLVRQKWLRGHETTES